MGAFLLPEADLTRMRHLGQELRLPWVARYGSSVVTVWEHQQTEAGVSCSESWLTACSIRPPSPLSPAMNQGSPTQQTGLLAQLMELQKLKEGAQEAPKAAPPLVLE